jgi:hypothetical protein
MFFAIINFNKTIEINDKLCYGYIARSYFGESAGSDVTGQAADTK